MDKVKNYIKKVKDVYHYDISVSGKRFRGSCHTDDVKKARTIAARIYNEAINNKFNLPSDEDYIFSDVFEIYMEKQECKASTVHRKIVASKNFLPFFKDYRLSDITKSIVTDYRLKRRKEVIEKNRARLEKENLRLNRNKVFNEDDVSFRTINLEIEILRNFFNYCLDEDYMSKNPCMCMDKLVQKKYNVNLSKEEILALIHGATNPLTRNLIAFLIFSGCRKSEALNLEWSDIDFGNELILIKNTKSKEDRKFKMHSALIRLLRSIPPVDGCPYVFNRNGRKLLEFKRSFHTACRNAGLESKKLRVHDLRHAFGALLVGANVSLKKTSWLLGHSDTRVTEDNYIYLLPENTEGLDPIFEEFKI